MSERRETERVKEERLLARYSLLRERAETTRCQIYKGEDIHSLALSLWENPDEMGLAQNLKSAARQLVKASGSLDSKSITLSSEETIEEALSRVREKGKLHWKIPAGSLKDVCFIRTENLIFGFNLEHLSREHGTLFTKLLQVSLERGVFRFWGEQGTIVGYFFTEEHREDYGIPRKIAGRFGRGGKLEVMAEPDDVLMTLYTGVHEVTHKAIERLVSKLVNKHHHAKVVHLEETDKRLEFLNDGMSEMVAAKVVNFNYHERLETIAEAEKLILSGEILDEVRFYKDRYRIGQSLCGFLIDTGGDADLYRKILEEVILGRKIPEAVEEVFGRKWADIGREWLASLGRYQPFD